MSQLSYGGSDDCLVNPASNNLGFYGAAPVAQRTGTIQGTAVCAASVISASAALGAWAGEVRATLVGLGLWAGA